MRSSKLIIRGAISLTVFLGGCMTVQPTAFPVGNKHLAAKPAGTPIQLFKDTKPTRPFEVVAKLNVHIEKTFFMPSAFDEALPKLEELARQQGADALIDVGEKKSRLNETFIYNVTATAVVFTGSP